ncbi:MAG: hypothetical protein LiPW39_82 [Parcubacteria group bacterium LiPW_39]|nr:MAG: hypothetical protein LiPW39_82 [Parcubacteria group bacterium LiPW_39]
MKKQIMVVMLVGIFVSPWISWATGWMPQGKENGSSYLRMREMEKKYQEALDQIIDAGKIAKIMNNIDAWLWGGIIINKETREVWSFEAAGNWKKTEFGWHKDYKTRNDCLTAMNLYHDGKYELSFKSKVLASGNWLEEFKKPFSLDPGRHPFWLPKR